jgi:hypothetical protein
MKKEISFFLTLTTRLLASSFSIPISLWSNPYHQLWPSKHPCPLHLSSWASAPTPEARAPSPWCFPWCLSCISLAISYGARRRRCLPCPCPVLHVVAELAPAQVRSPLFPPLCASGGKSPSTLPWCWLPQHLRPCFASPPRSDHGGMELAQLPSHLCSPLSISVWAAARWGRPMSATLAKCSMKYRSELHLDLRSPNSRRHNTLVSPLCPAPLDSLNIKSIKCAFKYVYKSQPSIDVAPRASRARQKSQARGQHTRDPSLILPGSLMWFSIHAICRCCVYVWLNGVREGWISRIRRCHLLIWNTSEYICVFIILVLQIIWM